MLAIQGFLHRKKQEKKGCFFLTPTATAVRKKALFHKAKVKSIGSVACFLSASLSCSDDFSSERLCVFVHHTTDSRKNKGKMHELRSPLFFLGVHCLFTAHPKPQAHWKNVP
ncbi:hypothetical protein K4925_001913 [Enterococcus faecalis]|nr:hypothetical protein [Enterococcus faecalis]